MAAGKVEIDILRPSKFLAPKGQLFVEEEEKPADDGTHEENELKFHSDYAHSMTPGTQNSIERRELEQQRSAASLIDVSAGANNGHGGGGDSNEFSYNYNVEPYFHTKRVCNFYGERILVALRYFCSKIELLAVLPQLMSRLALGDTELEGILGEEITDALIQLLFIQMRWIEAQSGKRFRYLGKTIEEIKRKLQDGVKVTASTDVAQEADDDDEDDAVDSSRTEIMARLLFGNMEEEEEGEDGDLASFKRRSIRRKSSVRFLMTEEEEGEGYDGENELVAKGSTTSAHSAHSNISFASSTTSIQDGFVAPSASSIFDFHDSEMQLQQLSVLSIVSNNEEFEGEQQEEENYEFAGEYGEEFEGEYEEHYFGPAESRLKLRRSVKSTEPSAGTFYCGELQELKGAEDSEGDEEEEGSGEEGDEGSGEDTTAESSLSSYSSEDEDEEGITTDNAKNANKRVPSTSQRIPFTATKVIQEEFNDDGCNGFKILSQLFDNPKEIHRSEYLKASYREVLRLLTKNKVAMQWIHQNINPEVSQSMKVFYAEIQILYGLMFARLLMSPDEEIGREHHIRQTWIREQRLLHLYDTLKVEYSGLSKEKEEIMTKLNTTINSLIQQIDTVFQLAHQEINKISTEANKLNLVTIKAFDQELQQLDIIYQRAFQFATSLRYKISDEETTWRKRRLKLQSELEAVIGNYDTEMNARQEILDQVEEEEKTTINEREQLEKDLAKIERKFEIMMEERRLKELEAKLRRKKRKKKGKKDGKGGKKKRKGGKGKKKKGGKGKAKKGKRTGAAKKGKKKPKAKAATKGRKGAAAKAKKPKVKVGGKKKAAAGGKKKGKGKKAKKIAEIGAEEEAQRQRQLARGQYYYEGEYYGEGEEEFGGEGEWIGEGEYMPLLFPRDGAVDLKNILAEGETPATGKTKKGKAAAGEGKKKKKKGKKAVEIITTESESEWEEETPGEFAYEIHDEEYLGEDGSPILMKSLLPPTTTRTTPPAPPTTATEEEEGPTGAKVKGKKKKKKKGKGDADAKKKKGKKRGKKGKRTK